MLRKSRVRDWILEQWTPSSLWMPEHSMQVRMPKFVESHVGSEGHRRSIIRTPKAYKRKLSLSPDVYLLTWSSTISAGLVSGHLPKFSYDGSREFLKPTVLDVELVSS